MSIPEDDKQSFEDFLKHGSKEMDQCLNLDGLMSMPGVWYENMQRPIKDVTPTTTDSLALEHENEQGEKCDD